MPKILITGGAGFVGSHLCEKLSKNKNIIIYSLDNYFTGREKNHVRGVNYIKGNTNDIDKLIKFKPDIVYHLGEYSRVEQSFNDLDKVWKYNKEGTFSILKFCHKNNAKLIYAGSSTKFSDGGLGREQSPYAWTKASNTELIKNFASWYGLSYAITYFYNVYGPREISSGKYATLISIFKNNFKKNKPLTVVSPGSQKRNFTHVDDITDGIILVGKYGQGDNYGIGHHKSYSILEVAKIFGGKIEMLPERKGNRMSATVETQKIKKLGWKPKIDLQKHINLFLKEVNNDYVKRSKER